MGRGMPSGGAGTRLEIILGQWDTWRGSGAWVDNRNNTSGQLQQLCAMLGQKGSTPVRYFYCVCVSEDERREASGVSGVCGDACRVTDNRSD